MKWIFAYILICRFLNFYRYKVWYDYFLYIKLSGDSKYDFAKKIFIDPIPIYIGTICEEIFFRLPLLYFTSYWVYYICLLIFTVQHYDFKRQFEQNLIHLIFCFILGILLSNVTLEQQSIFYACLLHLSNNVLSMIDILPTEWRKKNPRKVISFIQSTTTK